jgi:hypothetical protein
LVLIFRNVDIFGGVGGIVNIFLLQIFILQSNKRDMDYSYPSLFQDSFVGRNRYHLNNYYRCIVVYKGWLLSSFCGLMLPYIYYWNLQFLNNVIIIITNILFPLAYVTIADFSYPIYKCRTFGLLVPKDFQHYLVFPSSDYERDCEVLSFYNVKNIMNNKIPL